jgi:DnaJ-class molecular chaperone
MSRVIQSKRVDSIQCFQDKCGRCGGTGVINSLGAGFGPCPVCYSSQTGESTGLANVFETFGSRHSDLNVRRSYADGVEVTELRSNRKTSKSQSSQ